MEIAPHANKISGKKQGLFFEKIAGRTVCNSATLFITFFIRNVIKCQLHLLVVE